MVRNSISDATVEAQQGPRPLWFSHAVGLKNFVAEFFSLMASAEATEEQVVEKKQAGYHGSQIIAKQLYIG